MRKAIFAMLSAIMLISMFVCLSLAEDQTLPDLSAYRSITGIVTRSNNKSKAYQESNNGFYYVHIKDGKGGPVTFAITDKTIFVGKADIDVGDTVTGYFRANAPMILIYPPRYTIAVLACELPEAQDESDFLPCDTAINP